MRRLWRWFTDVFVGRLALALGVSIVISMVAHAQSEGGGLSLTGASDGAIGGLISGALQWALLRDTIRSMKEDTRQTADTLHEHLRDHANGRSK